jgi:ATP-binding cassette subfamily F protein 3
VALAKVTFQRPHILLLDEPSNHLDIDAVEALIQV